MRVEGKIRLKRVLPLVLVFYSFLLLPPEVEFTIYGANLSSFRIVLLAVSVPSLWSAIKQSNGPMAFMDVAISVVGFWMMLSFMTIYGIESGFVRGSGVLIDTVLPYFVTRICIKSYDDLRYFLILCLPALTIAGGLLVIESFTGRMLVRPLFASIFGGISAYSGGEAGGVLNLEAEVRLGMLRAYGTFPHPILAGIMMVGLLPLYYFSGMRSWVKVLGILVPLTGFFGLSSAAFMALILALGTIVVYHLKAFLPKVTWWSISGMFALMIFTLHMVSKNGIIPVISRLTLTPHTAEYRIHIWEWGWINIVKQPWFGLGYRQWERLSWMGESVDAHFLALAMRHGLVVPIVLLTSILFGMIRLGLIVPFLPPKDRVFASGINISVVIFLLVGQTVAYFGSSSVVLMSVLGFLASAISYGNACLNTARRQRAELGMRQAAVVRA
jgi:O-antigen ligase